MARPHRPVRSLARKVGNKPWPENPSPELKRILEALYESRGMDSRDSGGGGDRGSAESIRCPQCGRTSHNPNDVRERYCGFCHQYHDQMGDGREG